MPYEDAEETMNRGKSQGRAITHIRLNCVVMRSYSSPVMVVLGLILPCSRPGYIPLD